MLLLLLMLLLLMLLMVVEGVVVVTGRGEDAGLQSFNFAGPFMSQLR